MDSPLQKVVNMHWYGTVAEKPENVEYVGRPSLYGNFVSEDAELPREDKVALHRIALHRRIVSDPEFTTSMMTDLVGKDLGCWCKHEKTFIPCHADNIAREIKWLTDLGWTEGMKVRHSFGLVDQYEKMKKELALLFPWDERNYDFAIWEVFLDVDAHLKVLEEYGDKIRLLEYLAKVVTRLDVLFQYGLRQIFVQDKIYAQCDAIFAYANPEWYASMRILREYSKPKKRKPKREKS